MKKFAVLLTVVLVGAIAVPAFTTPAQAQEKLRVAVVTPSTQSFWI